MVGVWVGRADGGPMAGLGAAAALAQTLPLRLQNADRTDVTAGDPARPTGTTSELCTATGAASPCPSRLAEFPRPRRPALVAAAAPDDADRLRIVQPAPDLRVWRSPEAPAGLDRLVLRATASPTCASWYGWSMARPPRSARPAPRSTGRCFRAGTASRCACRCRTSAPAPVPVVVE